MGESKIKVLQTTNYDMFVSLEGNRAVKDGRVNRIIKSIETIGYLPNPILVNENMEVIDGQGRLEALRRMKLPVDYIVCEGIGVKECRQMNIHQSNWTNADFIQSFAAAGNPDYIRLRDILGKTKMPTQVVLSSCMSIYNVNNTTLTRIVRNGEVRFSQADAERAEWELDYAKQFYEKANMRKGAVSALLVAAAYAYRTLDFQVAGELRREVLRRMVEIPPLSEVSAYLTYFDDYYNKGKRKDKRIHLALQYGVDNV